MKRVVAAALIAGALAGCANVGVRFSGDYLGGGTRGTPYLCAGHPYECTACVACGWVCAPFRLEDSHDPIGDSLLTLMWPMSFVDLPCEVALDTVFLPIDFVYWICKEGN